MSTWWLVSHEQLACILLLWEDSQGYTLVGPHVSEVIHACTESVGSHCPAHSAEAINSIRTGSAAVVSCSFQHQFHAFLCFPKVLGGSQHHSVGSDWFQEWAVITVSLSHTLYPWSHWLVGSWHMTQARPIGTNKTQFQFLYLWYRGMDPLSDWSWDFPCNLQRYKDYVCLVHCGSSLTINICQMNGK